MAHRIMLVDDEAGVVHALRRLLHVTPCLYHGNAYELEVETFTSAIAALERARHQAFELFLVDYRMPEMDGVSFLQAIRQIQPSAARLILSGYADLNGLVRAINDAKIYRFLAKPWNDYELVSALAEALAYRDLLVERERLADRARVAQGELSAEEAAVRQLKREKPGTAKVHWGPDGCVVVDEHFRDPYGDDF